ncbi:MAG TPA: UDP-N-acetylmuramoyl-L-alanine--D-glutamate ligase [Dehalococcoidia bacterium]|nr:UDP-N-acetylmuramoyl-L-alanine--D-glutamate ligase [Dehalococcoidia bacterium]
MRPLPADWAGRRVTIVGLAREGVALARYLAPRGADVTISDAKRAEDLAGALDQIRGLPYRLAAGRNRVEDLIGADVVFVSPGVPKDLPFLEEARRAGTRLSSETELFFQRCRGTIVGITGSSGKTTTTSLVGDILRASGRPTYVGGNIGRPLIEEVDSIPEDARVVLELSSFQLERADFSPPIAAVTNITPNHLDRHPSMEHYTQSKANLIRHQGPDDWAILNADDPGSRPLDDLVRGRALYFGRGIGRRDGACEEDGCLTMRLDGSERAVLTRSEVPLRGDHNVANALTAIAVAAACGVPVEVVAQAIRQFKAVEHRIEWVREVGGVAYYNDSIATAPERTLAALQSFQEPIVLLAGGRDKHLPWEGLAREIARRCRAVVVFGEAADLIAGVLAETPGAPAAVRAASVRDAVRQAADLARPGDVVLLSPGCTSYDQFRDFEERGRVFKQAVAALPDGG